MDNIDINDILEQFRPPLVRAFSKNYFFCNNCQTVVDPVRVQEIYNVCPQCGECEINNVYVPTYAPKNEFYRKHGQAYKRIAYFEALLTRVQAHHCFVIDRETQDIIKAKMNGDRSVQNLKKILKEMQMTKFYKCCYALMRILWNQNQQTPLSFKECDQLKGLFRQIQMPYEKYKIETRMNFMSYAFVIQKLFHLIGRDDLLGMLSLPKNIYLIYQHELIWAAIADELGWLNDKCFF